MHDAYDIYEIVKLNGYIEAIAAYDDTLLVGTKQGHLLSYSVSRKLGDFKVEVHLLNYNKNFSKKTIQQLDVIPAYHLLLSLSDNVVSVHNIHKLRTQGAVFDTTVLHKTKGATLFNLDITSEKSLTGECIVFVRLCVVIKRKLQLYYWKNGEFLELQPEITAPDIPRAIVWCKNALCLGYKTEYSIYNLSEGKFQELFPIGRSPEPIITRIDKDVFGMVKDTQCILMHTEGAHTIKYAGKWAEVPTSIVYDNPYLVAVLGTAIEVKTVDPNQFIQTLSISQPANLMARAQQGFVYIACATKVWCLQAVPVPQQIKSLLENKQFELALRLTRESEGESEEEKKKNVHNIQSLYAHHLFTMKQFQESMSQFLVLKTNPYDVIKLYPDLLPSQSPKSSSSPKLTDKETEASLIALIEYLTEVRHGLINQKQQKASLLLIIDTTLLKCYLQTNDAMVAPLLRLNMVHFVEAERVLNQFNKTSELVILYQTNGRHVKALNLLKQQHDVDKTVQYLQHLGSEHLNIIFDFAEWLVKENPKEALKIFTEDIAEIEQLPRPQILNFLLRTCKELAIPYLEHVIIMWKDTNPIIHTTLANLYREKYQSLKSDSKQEAQRVRLKLIEFLKKSKYYTPQTILDLFPKDDMLEERAIMLGKQGRHEQALSIYVCLLEDVESARQYCENVYANSGHDEVYALLMRILIAPPSNWLMAVSSEPPKTPIKNGLSVALEILRENPDKINPVQALAVLPNDVPFTQVKSYLLNSLRNQLHCRRKYQILKGLTYSEHLQIQEERMAVESQAIHITEMDICEICNKRFTNQSAFARLPSGVIVHYGCQSESKK